MMTAHETYAKFARYYDAYTRKFTDDVAFYTSLCQSDANIVEIGCGSGRILQPLLKKGFSITGIDISPDMLALAKKKLEPFVRQKQVAFSQHNLLDSPLPEQFDLALVTFYTFNYMLEHPERFLKNLFLSLTDNATCVLDLFVPKTLKHPERDNRESTHEFLVGDILITLHDTRTFSQCIEKRTQVYHEQGKKTQITTTRKYYSPSRIHTLLTEAGFTEIMFSPKYDAHHFKPALTEDEFTNHFLVQARKKG